MLIIQDIFRVSLYCEIEGKSTFYLAREVGKFGHVLAEKRYIMINEFKYGQTWKIWSSPLSLSLYSTFKFIIRLGLNHLREHKFKHSFQDTINPLCSCGLHIESTEHLLLHCPQFVNGRRTLQGAIGENTNSVLTQTFPFRNTPFN